MLERIKKSPESEKSDITQPPLLNQLARNLLAKIKIINLRIKNDSLPSGNLLAELTLHQEELKKITSFDNKRYPVSGTNNFIVIKNRSDNLRFNFAYYLTNEKMEKISQEYVDLRLLENYFLVAKLDGGLLTFIAKETGLVLNNKRYEQVKIITQDSKKEIIALTNNKWHWICGDPQKYKNRYPLGSEISNGYGKIDFSDDGLICGYDSNLPRDGRILTPQTIRDPIAA